jgi:serine/threonine protein kinase
MNSGTLIAGRYRLVRPIGKGAMGVVWEAIHEGTSRQVAIKLIVESTDELRRRLVREAHAYGALRHRNIVEILDVGETDDGDPFLVMQLLVGETLADRLTRQRRLGVPEATRIARDVARALATAHAASIIHRDLKPANIFLHDEPGEEITVVKVVDFGVSKNLLASDGLSTVAGGMVGSPAYMSPEQAAAGMRGAVDHRADLWSLGVVLFEMLTGVRPLQGDSVSIIPQLVSGEIPLVTTWVRTIDPRLAALVARCLDRDLSKRIGSAADLAAQLQSFTSTTQGPGTSSPVQSGPGISPPLASGDAAAIASPRAPFTPAPEWDSARSPRLQGGPLPAGQTRLCAVEDEDDDDQATMKFSSVSPEMLNALSPGAQPAAPSPMSPRPGTTEPLQSWPAPSPTTAKLDLSAAWGAQPSMTNEGTERITSEDRAKLRSAGAVSSPPAAPPAPPAPAPGTSSVSSTSSLIQQSGAAPLSDGEAATLQHQKRLRTTLLVAGTVVGVSLAVLAVVMILPTGGVKPAQSNPETTATVSTRVAPVAPVAPVQAPSATATQAVEPIAPPAPTRPPVVPVKSPVVKPSPVATTVPSTPKPSGTPAPAAKPGGSKLPGFLHKYPRSAGAKTATAREPAQVL